MGIKKLLLFYFFVAVSFAATAQKGTLKGLVKDKKTKEPLVGATILLEGTTTGTITDFDGLFILTNVSRGTYKIRCSFISYETEYLENVSVTDGNTVELNIELGESTVELGDVKVVARVNRESESILLLEQKNSILATQGIGAQEISRKGVSDAEGAVTKISGISKQEGVKNVFVRGLGDRYNITTLNGFPVPSEDPEYKNISLDLFSSEMIRSVGVSKVFGAEASGDVGGAGINISSKELTGESEFTVELSVELNEQTIGKKFLKADGVNSFGFADKKPGPTDLSQYRFHNSLDPSGQSSSLNRGFAVSGGKRFSVGPNKNPFGFVITGSYSTDFNYQKGLVRNTGTTGVIVQDLEYNKYNQGSSHLGLVNADYHFKNNSLSFNGLYVHANKQYIGEYYGKQNDAFQDSPDETGLLRRQQINDNWVIVNQLSSEWELADNWKLDAGLSYNFVQGNEPDRRVNYLSDLGDGQLRPTGSTGRHQRYFSGLSENGLHARFALMHDLSGGHSLTAGYSGSYVKRNFEAIEYDHSFTTPRRFTLDKVTLDDYFNQENLGTSTSDYADGKFLLDRNRDEYQVEKLINSAFGELVYRFNEKLTGVAGMAADKVNLTVDYNVNRGGSVGKTSIDELYFLPSLNLKYDPTEKSSFRLGASRTYTLPQDKEISPFRYIDVSFKSQGNVNLKASANYNLDLKYDYYLSSDELLSLTGFFKFIQDPISRVEIASAGGFLTYGNIADNATINGAELEIRKNIFKNSKGNEGNETKLSAGFNGSYILTDVTLRSDLSFTNKTSELEGAAPVIVNADLTYQIRKNDFSLLNSLVLNYYSDRIYTIGANGYQDIYEDGVTTLDFVSSAKLNKHWELKLKGKNLLDPDFRLTRQANGTDADPVVLSSYKKGIFISFGISYKL
ncbi:TonB-dependent receptor [Gaoshiqia sp. Z1-71]|uniref:TonB-dependent receptor n=1 Tax=Gaoshiqia hydrogeniformans TaxID=3290090 RepID=UPI003BF7C287